MNPGPNTRPGRFREADEATAPGQLGSLAPARKPLFDASCGRASSNPMQLTRDRGSAEGIIQRSRAIERDPRAAVEERMAVATFSPGFLPRLSIIRCRRGGFGDRRSRDSGACGDRLVMEPRRRAPRDPLLPLLQRVPTLPPARIPVNRRLPDPCRTDRGVGCAWVAGNGDGDGVRDGCRGRRGDAHAFLPPSRLRRR